MTDRYHFFGEIALGRGLVTTAQLLEALTEQAHDRVEGRPVTMLGQILLEKGFLSEDQIQEVLDELFPPELGEPLVLGAVSKTVGSAEERSV